MHRRDLKRYPLAAKVFLVGSSPRGMNKTIPTWPVCLGIFYQVLGVSNSIKRTFSQLKPLKELNFIFITDVLRESKDFSTKVKIWYSAMVYLEVMSFDDVNLFGCRMHWEQTWLGIAFLLM